MVKILNVDIPHWVQDLVLIITSLVIGYFGITAVFGSPYKEEANYFPGRPILGSTSKTNDYHPELGFAGIGHVDRFSGNTFKGGNRRGEVYAMGGNGLLGARPYTVDAGRVIPRRLVPKHRGFRGLPVPNVEDPAFDGPDNALWRTTYLSDLN